MEDRVPTKPGRVLITPENGSPAYYATVAMADEPTRVGTALNKANLLKDSTASAFGLETDAVPDEVLAKARQLITTAQTTANGKARVAFGSYTGDGKDSKNINLGFSPSVVILCYSGVYRTNDPQYVYDGVATSSNPLQATYTSAKKDALTLTGSGFTVYYNPNSESYQPSAATNLKGEKYVYTAFE